MPTMSNNSESTEKGGERQPEVTFWRIADIRIPEEMVARQERVLKIAASIEEIGQLEAILLKPDATLVAGLHRFRACEYLGHETIEAKVLTLDDARLRLAAIDENLIRKELEVLERAELVHERKQLYETLHPEAARPKGGRPPKNGEPTAPFSEVTANLTGRGPRTVQQDVQIVADIPQDVRDQIRRTAMADNKKELLKLARHDEPSQRKLAAKLAEGTVKHLYEAEREVRMDDALERVGSLPDDTPHSQLVTCTCEDLIGEIDAGSVDLILTDPPYGQDALSCYEELGRLGAHALTPNGSMLVMIGQMHLFEVLQALREHLDYRWVLAYVVKSGGSPIVPTVQARVNTWWKPVLWFTRPGYAGDVHGDVIDSGPKTKVNHEWEQDEAGMARLIELFSLPGQVVVDPFLGSGTTGVAALHLDRCFVGCDDDPEALVGARVRLHDASPEKAA